MGVSAAILFAACTYASSASNVLTDRAIAALLIALLIGMSGGAVYERIALAAPRIQRGTNSSDSRDATRTLGIVVGVGGAIAFLAQYVLQNVMPLGFMLGVCFAICFGVLIRLTRSARPTAAVARDADRRSRTSSATPLASPVVVAAYLFALLSFYEPVMRATGGIGTFYEWYRLFGMTGYVAIGVVAYAGGRPATSITIVTCALFTVIVLVQTALMETGSATMILY